MNISSIIQEISFEKDCSLRKATDIYEKYKSEDRIKELLHKLKTHKEV